MDEPYECEICLESNCILKLYPQCQHYACSICTERMARENREDGNTFECQSCRIDVQLPLQDFRMANNHNDRLRNNEPFQTVPIVASQQMVEHNSIDYNLPAVEEKTFEEYKVMIEQERRCDRSCPPACVHCGNEFIIQMQEVISETGETCYETRDDQTTLSMRGVLMVPFRILQMIKTVRPCVGIFSNDAGLRKESLNYAAALRGEACQLALKNNSPSAPAYLPRLMIISSVLMVIGSSINIICGSTKLAQNIHRIPTAIGCSFNIAVFLGGTVICIFHCINKNKSWRLSSFLIQHLFMELSIYPQLCVSAVLLRSIEAAYIIQFVISGATLISVWGIRLSLLSSYKQSLGVIFRSVIFVTIGNYIIVATLIAGLVVITFSQQELKRVFILQIITSVVLSTTTIYCSLIMFYISYLYEITQVAALFLIASEQTSGAVKSQAKELLDDLVDLPPFHKTFYSMTMKNPLPGVVAYFYPLPFILMFSFSTSTESLIITAIYCGINVLVNPRAFLTSAAAHITAVTVILMFIFILLIALTLSILYMIVLIVLTPFFIIRLIIYICCKPAQGENNEAEEQADDNDNDNDNDNNDDNNGNNDNNDNNDNTNNDNNDDDNNDDNNDDNEAGNMHHENEEDISMGGSDRSTAEEN